MIIDVYLLFYYKLVKLIAFKIIKRNIYKNCIQLY